MRRRGEDGTGAEETPRWVRERRLLLRGRARACVAFFRGEDSERSSDGRSAFLSPLLRHVRTHTLVRTEWVGECWVHSRGCCCCFSLSTLYSMSLCSCFPSSSSSFCLANTHTFVHSSTTHLCSARARSPTLFRACRRRRQRR